MNSPTFWDFIPFLLKGVPITLSITFMAMALAIPVAIVLALGRMSSIAIFRWPAALVVEVFRGSSSLVQLFWAFYVLPFFGVNLPALAAGVMVLGFNSGSYLSEVVRAGLNAVPVGQTEAATTLGFSGAYRFFRIILPQALPLMVPPFGNALITMLKFTSLVSLVTIQELAFRASLVGTSIGESGPVFSLVLLLYFLMALALGRGAKLLEHFVNRRAGRENMSTGVSNNSSVPEWAFGFGR